MIKNFRILNTRSIKTKLNSLKLIDTNLGFFTHQKKKVLDFFCGEELSLKINKNGYNLIYAIELQKTNWLIF